MNIVLIYTLTYMILLIRIIFTIPHYPHYSYYPYSDLYASLLMFMDFHKFLRIHTDLPYMFSCSDQLLWFCRLEVNILAQRDGCETAGRRLRFRRETHLSYLAPHICCRI